MHGELQSSIGSPELFPYSLDLRADTVSFIHMSRAGFEGASFLDARVLSPGVVPHEVAWQETAAAIDAARLTERCDYLFHIGHVGSTLMSRLLGAHPGIFALREPLVLRQLASLQAHEGEEHLSGCLKLLSRTFEPPQRALLKTTSFVSECAERLLARSATPRALMMYVAPESYLATILGGPNSRQEARLLAPGRLERLHRRIGEKVWSLATMSEGEMLALGWACEMTALTAAVHSAADRLLAVDFDRFLRRPELYLHAALRHLGIQASTTELSGIIAGPHLRQYSKAPEYAYDAALRREILSEARVLNAAEIRSGLRWLERGAARFTALRDALTVVGGGGDEPRTYGLGKGSSVRAI
jgi:hypothetical protein